MPVVPGSMPSTVLRLDVLEDLVRYVEVRVDLLDVIEFLELLHETQHLARAVAFDADGRRRAHRDLRRSDLDAGFLERCLHLLERARGRVGGHQAAVGLDVLRARVDRDERHVIGRTFARVYLDDALLLEEPLHRAGLAELAAVLRERGAHLRGRAVAIVRGRFDHDGYATRRVTLVHDALERGAVAATGGAVDGALDVRV